MNPKRFFFLMIVVLVMSAMVVVAGFVWGDKYLKQQSKDISRLMAENDALQKGLDDINRAEGSLADKAAVEALISAVLPAEKTQQNLIANIINTATTQAGIPANRISSISFSGTGEPDELSGATASKEIPGVYYYPFAIVFNDISYDTLLKFFGEIEKNKRIIQADQVQISPNKAEPGMLSSVNLSLKTFIKP